MNALKNKVQLIGNLGKDPEIKVMKSGTKLAIFTLATHEAYQNQEGERVEETQWHNVVAWGKLAEIAEKILSKGIQVVIDGKLHNSSYDDKDGVKRYKTEVVANELLVVQGK